MEDDNGVLDLNEIPGGNQFEHFTADFLSCLGYKILEGPGEGPDGGKDMIVSQTVTGHLSETTTIFLVSCKHLGRAVGSPDELNIYDRLSDHDCDAFLGMYSSHPSQKLVERFTSLKTPGRKRLPLQIEYFTGAEIKKELLELPDGPRLVRQYLPRSHLAYLRAATESSVYRNRPVFRCHECKMDILQDFEGTVVYDMTYDTVGKPNGLRLHDIISCCRAHPPTRDLLRSHAAIYPVEQLVEPARYIRLVQEDMKFQFLRPPYFMNEAVHRKWLHLTSGLFYFVARGRVSPPDVIDDGLQMKFFEPHYRL